VTASSVAAAAADRRSAFRFIICLGIVSLFADMTYEGADAIRGPFLKSLGATAFQVGFISGLGEMLAASLRFFSGRMADRTHAYWAIAILGKRRRFSSYWSGRERRSAARRAMCCCLKRPNTSVTAPGSACTRPWIRLERSSDLC
jgi:hypothetical protein